MGEIKKLFSLMGRRKYGYLTGILITACAETSIYIVVSFVLRDMYNAGVRTDMAILIRAAGIMGITTITVSILYGMFSYMYNASARKAMAEIRLKSYVTAGNLPVSYFEQNHSGDVVSRMTNDMQLLEQIYTLQIYSFAYTVIYGSASAVFMLLTDWQLSIYFLAMGGILLGINAGLAKALRRLSKKIQELQSRLTSGLSDLLSGLKIVRMFHLEVITYKEYEELNRESVRLNKRRANKNALIESTNYFMGTASYAGLVAVGVLMATLGKIEVDKVIGLTQLMMGVTFMFQQLGNAVAGLQSSLAGARRVTELLNEKPEPESYHNLVISEQAEYALSVEHLYFSYDGSANILEDISLNVKAGEMIAIVGNSGSGKSTLIKVLLGLYEADSGMITVKNNATTTGTINRLRSSMSYVSQDVCLFNASIRENVSYGRFDAKDAEIEAVCRAAHAHDFIVEFEEGYDTSAGENGSRLSGGQKQRIALARALLKEAPIILLDEATSALDNQTERYVQESMVELIKGRTAIVVAHRLSTIKNADRIYVMDKGRIVECGSHDELLQTGGVYAGLYHIQRIENKLKE